MKSLHFYPWVWAAVTLSSVLAMPAWSAAEAAKPAKAPVKAEAKKPAPAKPAKVQAAKPTATVAVKPPAKTETHKAPATAITTPKPTAAPVKAESAKPARAPVKAEAPKAPVKKEAAKPAPKKREAKASVKHSAPAPVKKHDSVSNKPFIVQVCGHRVHGTYVFGRAPYGCDADQYESSKSVLQNLNSLVFDETKEQKSEIRRYTTNMYRFIRDAADEYITKRNPNVSAAEKEAFRNGVFALAHQESFWSHYRIARNDNRLKMMKGDQDFSFGMMQIHGRWHKDMLMKYHGWTVKGNLAYGMDMYYQAWRRTRNASCVKNFDQRARAAYSVYNAGGWASCRWTNPDDKWARNDTGFWQKYTGKLWNKLIDKSRMAELPSDVQMACLFDEGGSSCEAESGTAVL